MIFGTDISNDVNDTFNNLSFMKLTTEQNQFYYHNVGKPVLFNKFNTSFFGPTSLTTCKKCSTYSNANTRKRWYCIRLVLLR